LVMGDELPREIENPLYLLLANGAGLVSQAAGHNLSL